MAQSDTQTMATFTGTLLKREHTLGQKFVQLVFREKDKNWLCVSTNLTYAKLQSGREYRIQGFFKLLADDRQYIHEPEITPTGNRLGLKRLLLSVGVVLVVALLTTFAVRLAHGNLTPTSAESNTGHHIATTKVDADTTQQTASAPAATEQQAPTPAPTAPATTTKKKTTSSTPPSSTNNTPAVTPGNTPQNPQPYCGEQFNIVPFGYSTQEDPDHEVGYVIVQGVNGYTQTCYSGVAGDPGTTTVTPPTTQVTAVQPATPPAEG